MTHPNFVQITGPANILAVAAGTSFGMALDISNQLWTWGFRGFGELADASNAIIPPVQVSPATDILSGATLLASNVDVMAYQNSSSSYLTWGSDPGLFLGGSLLPLSSPAAAPGLVAYSTIFSSSVAQHALGLDSNGNLSAWGLNTSSQLGTTSAGPGVAAQILPSASFPGIHISTAAAGARHSMAIDTSGNLYGWGDNSSGQMGLNFYTTSQSTPISIPASGFITVACGARHSAGIQHLSTYSLWTWGADDHGQIGQGATLPDLVKYQPTSISTTASLTSSTSLSAGNDHTLLLDGTQSVWAWGSNQYGQIGTGIPFGHSAPVDQSVPVEILPAGDTLHIVQVCAGPTFSLALDNLGMVWGWGDNSKGQLGLLDDDGNPAPVLVPTPLPAFRLPTLPAHGFSSLAATQDSVVAVDASGQVWTWGWNNNGMLGLGPAGFAATTPALAQPEVGGQVPGANGPTVYIVPATPTTMAGLTVTFTAYTTGNPAPTVQWSSSTDGTTFTPIPSATNATYTYTVQPGDNGLYFQAAATNSSTSLGTNTSYSNTVQLSVIVAN